MSAPLDTDRLVPALEGWLRRFDSALVAYSGGVDSAVVLAAAHRALGARAAGAIGVSASLPRRELEAALELAADIGARVHTLVTEEVSRPDYAANPANRCYFCKQELFTRLAELARAQGLAVVLDGTNASDSGDDRPGRAAALERGVRSPLLELGLTKDQVRAAARALGLRVWDKPAMACLASRVPQGVTITPALLARVEQAENVLAGLGFRQFRVRHHGELARIELQAGDLPRALDQRQVITEGVKAAGYRWVCLDLAGFRAEPAAATSSTLGHTTRGSP